MAITTTCDSLTRPASSSVSRPKARRSAIRLALWSRLTRSKSLWPGPRKARSVHTQTRRVPMSTNYPRITRLETAGLPFNDPRHVACAYRYCDQVAGLLCETGTGPAVTLCVEHAAEFTIAWSPDQPGPILWQCTGDAPGEHVACDFDTYIYNRAVSQFEHTGHAVEVRS